jgi:hypothetical protein
MNKILFLIPILLLTGCGNEHKFSEAVKEIEERCIGKVGVEVVTSTYSESVSFTCDDIRKSSIVK